MKFYFLPIAIAAVVALRIIMHFVDKERIKDEVGARGGWVISIRWNPFARGWFFEKNERHYEVTYRNRAGAVATTTCKTSLFSGVYWSEPQTLQEPPKRIIARHHCSKCGYAINAEWRTCPNCGTATGFA